MIEFKVILEKGGYKESNEVWEPENNRHVCVTNIPEMTNKRSFHPFLFPYRKFIDAPGSSWAQGTDVARNDTTPIYDIEFSHDIWSSHDPMRAVQSMLELGAMLRILGHMLRKDMVLLRQV